MRCGEGERVGVREARTGAVWNISCVTISVKLTKGSLVINW